MKKNYLMLSYPMQIKMPLFRGSEPLSICYPRAISKGNSCNTAVVSFFNHAGTHMDMPNHFYDHGKKISDFLINDFIFKKPMIVDCSKDDDELITPEGLPLLKGCDLVLLRTGFGRHRKDFSRYSEHNPGLSPEAAEHMRRNFPNIRAIGIDTVSIAAASRRDKGRATHQILLDPDIFSGHPIFVVEDMCLQSNVHLLGKVYVVPWIIEGIDSSPCTVFAEMGTK